MSLDKIHLSAPVFHNLYSKSLYEFEADKSSPEMVESRSISFLGTNERKIAFLVNAADSIYLPDDELNFLLGILSACKLSMADIALINVSKNPGLLYTVLTDQLKAEKIFLFGLKTAALELPLQFPHYQIQQFNNQVYLSSTSLTELQKDKAEKMKLWDCLKTIFSL